MHEKKQTLLERAFIGGIAAFPRVIGTQPFATTLARVQANCTPIGQVVKEVYNTKGVKGFYTGSVSQFIRFVSVKLTGVPTMSWAYETSKSVTKEHGGWNLIAPPVATAVAMGAHDWAALAVPNYYFYKATLSHTMESKGFLGYVANIYNSARALPVLQTARWMGFLGTREIFQHFFVSDQKSLSQSILSGAFSAAVNCTFIPFLERLNTECNYNPKAAAESLWRISQRLIIKEGGGTLIGTPLVFCNSFITLMIWDAVLTYTTKKHPEIVEKF